MQAVGLTDLIAGLAKEAASVDNLASGAVARTAQKVEAAARSLAPEGPTGDLKRSIESSISKTRAEVGPTVRYGRFVEYGTYKDAPQPYMGPAADQHGEGLVKEIERVIGEL